MKRKIFLTVVVALFMSFLSNAENLETPLKLEKWMIEDDYWAVEPVLKIENWMLNPYYWSLNDSNLNYEKFEGRKIERFEGKRFEGKRFEGKRFEGKRFEGKRFEGRKFEGKRFEGRKFEGRKFEGKSEMKINDCPMINKFDSREHRKFEGYRGKEFKKYQESKTK